jgi:hypothetical protein
MSPIIQNDTESYNSIMLNLQTLMSQYNNILLQYNQASLDYANYIKQAQGDASILHSLTQVPGKNYLGTGQAGSQASYSAVLPNDCQSLCASISNCVGATYTAPTAANADATCSLRTGISNLTSGNAGDYAIVPEFIKYLTNINTLNEQLVSLNNQIMSILTNPTLNLSTLLPSEMTTNEETLTSEYNALLQQRAQIQSQLQEYANLEEQQEAGNIYLTRYNYMYILFYIILIITIIVFVKLSYSTPTTSSSITGGGNKNMLMYIGMVGIIVVVVIFFNMNKSM